MSQILPFLYLGGKDECRSLSFLQEHEVQTIINMTPPKSVDPAGVPNYHEDDRRFRYHRFSLVDTMAENIIPTLKQAVELIERSRHYGNILVHCRQGVSRSAAIVAAYLIRYRGMTLASALAFLRKRRPIIRPNEAFLAQLERYEADVAELRRLGGIVPHDGGAPAAPARPAAPALAGSKRSARESYEEAEKLVRPRGGGPGLLSGSVLASGIEAAAASSMTAASAAASPGVSAVVCEECGAAAVAVRCEACDVSYCVRCDADVHSVASIGDHLASRAPLPEQGACETSSLLLSCAVEPGVAQTDIDGTAGCSEDPGCTLFEQDPPAAATASASSVA